MNKDDVTIIIVTSIIPEHPSTRILEETMKSVRFHFPENEIILQIDGLRDERLSRKDDYDDYKNRVLWKCLHEWKNVLPVVFSDFSHQTTMMRETIDLIKTPLLLYVEGDAPLVTDVDIDWQDCLDLIDSGKAKTVRFHFEAVIPKAHSHLMLGQRGQFMKTCQWSQRPHLSLVSYYRSIILPPLEERTFIEDKTHGLVQEDYIIFGVPGWNKHKLWIYNPEGGNIKRSYHLDGRDGTQKFTDDDLHWGYRE